LKSDEEIPMDLLLLADPSKSIITSYIHRARCFIAELNQRIVGEYVLLATRPQTAEIVNLAVSEDMQGRGIGRQLVLHAVELARQHGFKELEIGTGNSSLGQLALYQKCGFRMASIDRDFFTRHYPQPIYENGLQCRDMVRLAMNL
jgi:ribosomal protein S18 acetylase RimI-like enzyme